jgi:hypothetical protein
MRPARSQSNRNAPLPLFQPLRFAEGRECIATYPTMSAAEHNWSLGAIYPDLPIPRAAEIPIASWSNRP